MENLIIEHKRRSLINIVIGCLWILFAIILLLLEKDPLDKADWNKSIIIFILGIIILTQPFLRLNRSKIQTKEGYLIIHLIGWIRHKKIKESDIERITLGSGGIKLYRTQNKPVSIFLYNMGKNQREQVFRFFTEYAQQNNFTS